MRSYIKEYSDDEIRKMSVQEFASLINDFSSHAQDLINLLGRNVFYMGNVGDNLDYATKCVYYAALLAVEELESNPAHKEENDVK